MDERLIQPSESDPLVEETRAFWRETGRTFIRESIGSIDETAKQIAGVAGVLVGLYFNAIAFGDLRGTIDDPILVAVYLAPIALLIVSVTAALWVFFPGRYGLNLLSSEAGKTVYERVLHRKLRALRIASIFLVLAVLAVLVAVFRYLRG